VVIPSYSTEKRVGVYLLNSSLRRRGGRRDRVHSFGCSNCPKKEKKEAGIASKGKGGALKRERCFAAAEPKEEGGKREGRYIPYILPVRERGERREGEKDKTKKRDGHFLDS